MLQAVMPRWIRSISEGIALRLIVLLVVVLGWLVPPFASAHTWSPDDVADPPIETDAPALSSAVEVYLVACPSTGPPEFRAAVIACPATGMGGTNGLSRRFLFIVLRTSRHSAGVIEDAFGMLIASTGSSFNRFRYCGEEWDANLGMYNLRARWMEPGRGRFWNADTFDGSQEEPESLHKYLYCGCDPVNHLDPSGHEEEEDLVEAEALGDQLEANSAGAAIATGASAVGQLAKIGFVALTFAALLEQQDSNPKYVYFVHGTSTASFGPPYDRINDEGRGDFGVGFYTFCLTTDGQQAAYAAKAWALKVARKTSSEPILLVYRMPVEVFAALPKYRLDGDLWQMVVDSARDDDPDLHLGAGVVIGPISTGSRPYTPIQNLPSQYKFEPSGALFLQFDHQYYVN